MKVVYTCGLCGKVFDTEEAKMAHEDKCDGEGGDEDNDEDDDNQNNSDDKDYVN